MLFSRGGCGIDGWVEPPMTKDLEPGAWRPMRAGDIAALSIVSDAVHGAYTEKPAIYAERLSLYPAGCFVFEQGGRITGYLLSHPWYRDCPPALDVPLGAIPEAADTFYLHDIALLPEARGTGAGRAATALVLRQAKASGFNDIHLIAVNEADGFWASQGFTYVVDEDAAQSQPYGPGSHYMRRPLAD